MEIKAINKAIRKYNLDKPTQIVKMAKVLKRYIVENKLFVNIAGNNYVLVEGWQFAGGLLGFFPRVVEVKLLEENKWMAKVEIIKQKDGSVVSSGFALCSKKEAKKKTFDEYAILSMAQTRAIGKAFRNLIGWVMKLAGYEPTPAEEMKSGVFTVSNAPQSEKKQASLSAFKCMRCKNKITKAEADYSKRIYKSTICRNCQKGRVKRA